VEIECLALGDFETNCYVVRASKATRSCWIIDPGFAAEPLVEYLRKARLEPREILLTHGHCDHIAGIPLLREHFGAVPVQISREDAGMLTDNMKNLSAMAGASLRLEEAEKQFSAGETMELDGMAFKVLGTPGHTPGGSSFYSAAEGLVFTGDALFAGSVGRSDFPGGNERLLLQSIREQLFVLGDATRVLPGHGPETSIGQEKRSNPFFQ
jgi:hydroxyacylglutathione hydrolase